jgi:hypothetical protein
VDWVHPSGGLVGEDPSLDFTLGGLGQNSVGDIRETNTVDEPHLTVTLEGEVVVNLWVSCGLVNHGKGVGNGVVGSVGNNVANDELQDHVGVEVVGVSLELLLISEGQVLADEWSEVNDDFVTFSNGNDEVGDVSWGREETSVGTDSSEGLEGGWGLISSEEEIVGSGNTSIQHAESVLAGFDLEEWVWETVDTDDVTVKGDTLVDGGHQGAVCVEVLSSKHKGDVELSSGEAELTENGVNQLVETSLSEVGVDGGDTDGVVVVPESTLGLTVGVVVVLELTGEGNIFSPSIPWSSRVRTVQVDGGRVAVDVDESDNSLATSSHLEGVTWSDGTITSEGGRS